MKILKALQSVNEELGAIEKSQKMTHPGMNYKFRGIDQVFNALSPLFKKHGILISRRNLVTERSFRSVVANGKDGKTYTKEYVETYIKTCDYVFTSVDDGSEFVSQGFGEGQDSSGGDKSSGKATSNAFKYVIFEMFTIPTEEQKDSDQSPAVEPDKIDYILTFKKSLNEKCGGDVSRINVVKGILKYDTTNKNQGYWKNMLQTFEKMYASKEIVI